VSQVILHGKPLGDEKWRVLMTQQKLFFRHVCDSLKALLFIMNVIVWRVPAVLAEINLYKRTRKPYARTGADAPVSRR